MLAGPDTASLHPINLNGNFKTRPPKRVPCKWMVNHCTSKKKDQNKTRQVLMQWVTRTQQMATPLRREQKVCTQRWATSSGSGASKFSHWKWSRDITGGRDDTKFCKEVGMQPLFFLFHYGDRGPISHLVPRHAQGRHHPLLCFLSQTFPTNRPKTNNYYAFCPTLILGHGGALAAVLGTIHSLCEPSRCVSPSNPVLQWHRYKTPLYLWFVVMCFWTTMEISGQILKTKIS